MKFKSPIMTCLLALGLVAAAQAQDIKIKIPGQTTTPAVTSPAPAATPAAPAQKFTEAQMLEEYGWMIGKRIGLADLNFTPEQVDLVLRGIAAGCKGKESPSDVEKIGQQMQDFIKGKQGEYLANLREVGRRQSAAFLSDLKKKPGITVLPSGLCYEISNPGTGPAPKATDTVTVNFTGRLVDGTIFSSNEGEGGSPVDFPVSKMIPGWIEGLQKIAKGGKIRLYIPPDLAFGDTMRQDIPPASTLVFDIEIKDIKPTPSEPMPEAPAATAPKLETNPATGK